jgi:hypothetical protein
VLPERLYRTKFAPQRILWPVKAAEGNASIFGIDDEGSRFGFAQRDDEGCSTSSQ